MLTTPKRENDEKNEYSTKIKSSKTGVVSTLHVEKAQFSGQNGENKSMMQKKIEHDKLRNVSSCRNLLSGFIVNLFNRKRAKIMHSSLFIANQFIEQADAAEIELTHMQVQKLVYFAHALSLSIEGKPLIREPFFAYPFGPIEKNLYNALRVHGRSPVSLIRHDNAEVLTENEEFIINGVFKRMGRLSGYDLSRRSHVPGGPWDVTWNRIEEFGVIENARIAAFYEK